MNSSKIINESLKGLILYENNEPLLSRIDELMKNWTVLYPRLDLRKQIRAAHAWELANQKKSNKARFLNNWMRIAQEWAEKSPEYTRPFTQVPHLPPDPGSSQAELDDMHRQTVKALGPRACKDDKCGVCGK